MPKFPFFIAKTEVHSLRARFEEVVVTIYIGSTARLGGWAVTMYVCHNFTQPLGSGAGRP